MWKKLLNAASLVMTHFSYGYSDYDTNVIYLFVHANEFIRIQMQNNEILLHCKKLSE